MKKLLFLLLLLPAFLSAQQQVKSKIRVACVGNSITFGASLSNPARDSYPSVLGQMLGKEYDVRNFGVSGRTMLSVGDLPYVKEAAYARALAFNPDIVVVKLGTNDSKPQNWRYCDDFEKDLQALVDAFAALESSPRILLCTPATAYNVKGGISDSVIVNGVIPRICRVAERNGLPVLD